MRGEDRLIERIHIFHDVQAFDHVCYIEAFQDENAFFADQPDRCLGIVSEDD